MKWIHLVPNQISIYWADGTRKYKPAFILKNGGKPWRYIIISHTLVDRGYTFNYILSQATLKQPTS